MRWIASPPRLLLCFVLAPLACTTGGCLSLDRDVHLAPFYTHVSRAGGGTEVEALGGVVRVRPRTHPGGPSEWAVRPIVRSVDHGDGTSTTRFLVPLGRRDVREEETLTQMLPLFRFLRRYEDGRPKGWFLFTIPGLFWEGNDTGRILRAVFPFGGVMEDFFFFDRVDFVLFPLFMRTRRGEKTTWHFLFPLFAYSGGPEHSVRRVWPLYGETRQEGQYHRRFLLWPFFHWHTNSGPQEEVRTKWLIWPLFGMTRRGTFRSVLFLWPFFGYSWNPETGFSAWDGPWPLVRFQAPGKSGKVKRLRIWPFYGSMVLPDIQTTSVLWPIFSWRREKYRQGERSSQYVVPFWQNWNATGGEGDGDAWQKLWPVFQYRKVDGVERFATPALSPLWHTPTVDEHYAWLYEIYTREREQGGEVVRERSWAGLWRREKDAEEDRRSFSGLWARRSYRSEDESVRETSLLFGLLRWRKRAGKPLEWLRPSFPGPGWPTRRQGSGSERPMRGP